MAKRKEDAMRTALRDAGFTLPIGGSCGSGMNTFRPPGPMEDLNLQLTKKSLAQVRAQDCMVRVVARAERRRRLAAGQQQGNEKEGSE